MRPKNWPRRRAPSPGLRDSQKAQCQCMWVTTFSVFSRRAKLRLLSLFARHLSILSNQLVVRREKDESTNMTRARQFIEDHQAEPLSLGRIAQVANISRHYFCKMFKKATGINFTDYLSRVRVEKSKTLLLNPNSRISEVAFACGFQSMTNFNRAFKRIVRRSPTQFRESLPKLRRSV